MRDYPELEGSIARDRKRVLEFIRKPGKRQESVVVNAYMKPRGYQKRDAG